MNEQQITDALQKIHELTQQNCSESAGAAWADLLCEVIDTARIYPGMSQMSVISHTLVTLDILPKELPL